MIFPLNFTKVLVILVIWSSNHCSLDTWNRRREAFCDGPSDRFEKRKAAAGLLKKVKGAESTAAGGNVPDGIRL